MKKITSIFLLSLTILALNAQTSNGPQNGPIISFTEKSHDFGDLQQGEKVEYIFLFKNTGTQPLLISDVVTTCSCTAKQWNKEPVMPGKTGQITVSFDSAGKMGMQNKVITIISNATNSREMISIRINVIPVQKTE